MRSSGSMRGDRAALPAYRPGAVRRRLFQSRRRLGRAAAVVAQLADDARARASRSSPSHRSHRRHRELVIVCAGAWVPRLVPSSRARCARSVSPSFISAARSGAVQAGALSRVRRRYLAHRLLRLSGQTRWRREDLEPRRSVSRFAAHDRPGPDASDVASASSPKPRARAARDGRDRSLPSPIADRPPSALRVLDTADEDFWIARHRRARLVVATGGSGHAFQVRARARDLIASIALGEPQPLRAEIPLAPGARAGTRTEAAPPSRRLSYPHVRDNAIFAAVSSAFDPTVAWRRDDARRPHVRAHGTDFRTARGSAAISHPAARSRGRVRSTQRTTKAGSPGRAQAAAHRPMATRPIGRRRGKRLARLSIPHVVGCTTPASSTARFHLDAARRWRRPPRPRSRGASRASRRCRWFVAAGRGLAAAQRRRARASRLQAEQRAHRSKGHVASPISARP